MGLFSSIGKALFGGKKKTTSASSTGTVNPWAPAIHALTDFLGDSESLYANTPLFSNYETQALDALKTAAQPSDYFNTSSDTLNKTAAGEFLTPDTNPYLADIAKRISGIAGANAASIFGGRGRTSGGLSAYYTGKAIADSATDLYGSTYENERNRQQQAAGMAPQFDAARLAGPAAMLEAGQNISARPFDVNAQRGGVLAQIAGLGNQSTGTTQNFKQSGGLLGKITSSITNQLFPK